MAQGGDGIRVQADDGRRFNVYHPQYWPTVLAEDHDPAAAIAAGRAPDHRVTPYSMTDPFVATMIASLESARGPNVDPTAAKAAIRRLSIAPLVMDPDWSNTMLTSVTPAGPSAFALEILKRGTPLEASVGRSASAGYEAPRYEHASHASVEGRSIDAATFATILEQGGLGPRATPGMRAQVLAVLRKPTVRTDAPSE
ncbi:MAG: hypothetical protein KF795_01720 [Labilithrix sp.]|nr:hypothetical protein [Labilithrix sp.]